MPEKDRSSTDNSRIQTLAFAALLLGGVVGGLSPILVRSSDVGPVASAFWRAALALPFLWGWVLARERHNLYVSSSVLRKTFFAGLFFAADLALWHWSIMYTTVANSTLLVNFASVFVTLGGWWLFRQHVSGVFVIGMMTALVGTSLLVGPSFSLGGIRVVGDLLAVVAAVCYAAYILAIKQARERISTAMLMALSTTVIVVALFPLALLSPQSMLPAGPEGWSVLFGLALLPHVIGQGLLVYATAHLSAALSSVGVLTQPVVAAILAWLWFGEVLDYPQLVGGLLVLQGILIARRNGSPFPYFVARFGNKFGISLRQPAIGKR